MAYKNKPGAIALSLKELDDPLDIAKREQLLKELKEWENKDTGNVDSLLDLARKKALINGEDANIDVNDLLGSSELPMPDYPSVDDLKIYELTNKYRPGYGQTDGVASLATDTSFVNQPASVPEPSDDELANVNYPQRDNSARKFELQRMIDGYDRDIAKLQAEIAMSEAGDPMYNLAIMRLLMDDDNSLLMDIRGRIGKKIDQEFQERMKQKDQDFTASENEKNRENTREIAEMNRAETKAAQQRDLDNAFASAQQLYEFALGDLEANSNDEKLKREVAKAKELYRQAAVKAGRMDDFERRMGVEQGGEQKWNEAAAAYEVKDQTGLKAYVDSITDPKLKAAVLRDLERTYKINEKDLGYSGAETKINEKKGADRDAFNAAVNNALKLGPWDDEASAKKALEGLKQNVRDALRVGYDSDKRKYILRKKKVK